ncbi:MAG: precorrin-2 C(20)-methyltransferase [Firmicutes bacterium]|nr:precorrin-2 C(20)-methyltransferase [Bacillota bacterium]
MERGRYYSVSVGPGDPENMTLKAVRVLEDTPVIAVPQTRSGQTMALDIAERTVDFSNKEVVKVRFTMSRDPRVLKESREGIADELQEYLDHGRDVAMVNIGDVSIFSTAVYIGEILESRGYETYMIPGVTSFCAAAAEADMSLVEGDDRLSVISAGSDLDEALELAGTKIIMKSGKQIDNVIRKIRDRGLKACMVCNCGLENQKIFKDITEYDPEDTAGYFAVIIVR